MRNPDEPQETPDWKLPPRACLDHGVLCETQQHHLWLLGDAEEPGMIVRGEN